MTRRPLLLAISVSLLSSSALAAPVFMLQFGSFETRAEAETRLQEVKTKHSGLLGAMSSTIREVTLPPDNLKVYRTQAGPLPSRQAAQSVCSQLASNGDQCYVVETAMLPGADTPKLAVATPSVTMPSLSAPGVSLTPPSVEVNAAPIAGLGAAAMAEPTSVADEMAKSLAAPASAPMEEALAQAAATQSAMAQAPVVEQAAPAPAKTPRSFWSRLNPFSSSEEELPTPPKPAVVAEPMPVAAPVEEIASAPNLPPVAPVAPPAVEVTAKPPVATAATPFVVDPTMPPPPRPVVEEVAPVVAAAAPAVAPASGLPPIPMPTSSAAMPESVGTTMLPPPPAPLRARDRDALAAGQMPAVSAAASSPAAPAASASPFAAPSLVQPAQTLSPAPVMAQPVTLPSTPLPMSATSTGQKTLWAEIAHFTDSATALAFWENYRATHPDFPVVRTRVISAVQARGAQTPVSLRVGPFARHESIKNL